MNSSACETQAVLLATIRSLFCRSTCSSPDASQRQRKGSPLAQPERNTLTRMPKYADDRVSQAVEMIRTVQWQCRRDG
jgi:hypothetical protein